MCDRCLVLLGALRGENDADLGPFHRPPTGLAPLPDQLKALVEQAVNDATHELREGHAPAAAKYRRLPPALVYAALGGLHMDYWRARTALAYLVDAYLHHEDAT